jgi:cobalt/nickel transport system permease protein
MHIPDGFIDGPTSIATGAVAAGGIALCLRRSAAVLDERQVPLAGVVSAFVFAVQMLNFPVVGGTSGHLLGGVLAAVLVGPYVGALCIAVVVVVQALLFADGGLTALGSNVLNMGLVTAFGGYAVFRGLRLVLPRNHAGVVLASGIASGAGVVLAAVAFTIEYALGGAGGASLSTVAVSMIGVHALIGIGEGAITALTVSAVLAARPDLVHGARGLVTRAFADAELPWSRDGSRAAAPSALRRRWVGGGARPRFRQLSRSTAGRSPAGGRRRGLRRTRRPTLPARRRPAMACRASRRADEQGHRASSAAVTFAGTGLSSVRRRRPVPTARRTVTPDVHGSGVHAPAAVLVAVVLFVGAVVARCARRGRSCSTPSSSSESPATRLPIRPRRAASHEAPFVPSPCSSRSW